MFGRAINTRALCTQTISDQRSSKWKHGGSTTKSKCSDSTQDFPNFEKKIELTQQTLLCYHRQRWVPLRLLFLILCILYQVRKATGNIRQPLRSCRRLARNSGWWEKVWSTYTDLRFKKLLRVSRGTFQFILERIRHDLVCDTACEEPISPEFRLAICLYRLGRGDYLSTISEMAGLGIFTVCTVAHDDTLSIVNNLWTDCVHAQFPSDEAHIKAKILDTEQSWQFPCS